MKLKSIESILVNKLVVSHNDCNMFTLTCSISVQSLKSLKKSAEGLRQVLDMKPSAESVEIYREVLGGPVGAACPDLHHRLPSTIERAVSDAEYSADYVPASKIIHNETNDNM